MFAELKGAIAIRGQIKTEIEAASPSYLETLRQLEIARQTVKDFLLQGTPKMVRQGFTDRVAGWTSFKRIAIPQKDNSDASQAEQYNIFVEADFPKPAVWTERTKQLDLVDFQITFSGEHRSKVTASLPTTNYFSIVVNTKEMAADLAYLAEVIEFIRRDPYLPKTILVENPPA